MPRILPRWRKATWALVIWCLVILVWAIAGGASGAEECGERANELRQSACEAGTGIGVALILLVGFFGFIFFSLIWVMSRPKNRQCPQCGNDVKKGRTQCPSCGWSMGQMPQAAAPGTGIQA